MRLRLWVIIKMKNYKVVADCRGMCEQDIIDTILNNRGIKDVEHFLNPVQDDLLPLDSLKNIDKAYDIYRNAIDNNLNISILFDTDTDGLTAGAILTRYTREIQKYPCECLINNGKAHGLNGQDLSRFTGADLLIIVDSLDSTVDNYIRLKREYGVENIIVLDHHKIDDNVQYNEHITLVSSQRDYENKSLSGAGVVYKFICYCEEQESIDISDAEQYADLAACGILADVMDVSEDNYENRYIVNLGLNNLTNLGIKKILGGYDFNSKAVLFSIAPLFNAAVRVGENEAALQLLLTDDNKELIALKKVLEHCKELQNEEKERLLPDVRKQFDAQTDSIIKVGIINTPYGISGLIANTLLEEYKCPILVLNDCGDVFAGSMRSIGYGDFAWLINQTGLAEAHGHEEAAGFTCKADDLEECIFDLNAMLSNMEQYVDKEYVIDAEINVSDMTRNLAYLIRRVNFVSGNGFKPLTFKVGNVTEYGINSWSSGKHLLIEPTNEIKFIQWNTKLDFDKMEEHALIGDEVEVIGELEDGFVGRNYIIKLIIDDLKVG